MSSVRYGSALRSTTSVRRFSVIQAIGVLLCCFDTPGQSSRVLRASAAPDRGALFEQRSGAALRSLLLPPLCPGVSAKEHFYRSSSAAITLMLPSTATTSLI